MKKIHYIFLLAICFLLSNKSFAQLNTSGFRVDQASNSVEVCQGSSTSTYVVTAKTSTLNNFQIQLALPPGISYQIGSAAITTSPAGYTISEINVSNLQRPVLAIDNGGSSGNVWGVGHQVTFTVARTADCPAVQYSLAGFTFKDTIIIDYENAGAPITGIDADTTYGTYNADYTSLSILAISNASTTLNTPESRNITVRQGGNSCIEQFQHFVVVGRDIAGYQLSFLGNALAPTSIVANGTNTADTLFYTINLNNAPFAGVIGNNDNCFDNGEDIVFLESFSATACNELSIKHHARWGCTALEYCQAATPQTGPITFIGGAPSLSLTEVGGATAPELCDTISHTIRITNTASPTSPTGGSIAYDVAIIFGLGANNGPLATSTTNTLWGSNLNDTRYWGNFSIGTNTVSDSALSYYNNSANDPSRGTASLLIQDRLTFDPDGPGGLEDLDGDGFFDDLAPGASFEISFDYWLAIRDNCGTSNYYNYVSWEHKYFDVSFKNQCLEERTPVRRDLGYRNIIRNYLNSTFTATPPDVFEGQSFVVGIRPHFYNNGYLCRGENMFSGSQAKWSISLTLPTGVDTANAVNTIANLDSELSAYNPTITKIGNVVTYTLDRYVYDTLHFSLNYDCVNYTDSVILSIPYTTHYFCGTPGDTCFYREIHCGTLTNMLTHCPTNCNGPVIYSFDASRTTPGYTDNTRTTLVTLDPAIHKTKFYNPYDTMLVQARAYIKDTAIGNLFLNLSLTPTSGGTDFLTFVGGEVLVNDISSGTGFQSFVLDGMPANLTSIGGQNFEYTMDLSRYKDSVSNTYLFGGEDGSPIYSVDSIWVKAQFIVGQNFTTQVPHTINPFRANFSTLLSNGDAIACDSLGDIGQYERISFGWGANGVYTFSHCNEVTPLIYFTHSAFTGDDHPNEYRPPSSWDSVQFIIPNYRYTGNQFSWSNAPGFTILPHRISGDTVTMYRPATGYSDFDKRGTYYPPFRANIMGNCQTPLRQTMRAKNFYKEFAYHPDPTVHQNRENTTTATLDFIPPTWLFQALTPTVDGTQDTVAWDIELCNTTSNADIDYNWVTIPANANIQIEAIYNISTGTEIAIPYTESNDSIILELGVANRNSCQQYRLYATYNDCSNQAITLNHGWDCQAYPSNYEEVTSACYRSIDLLLEPRQAEVQLSIIEQPQTPQDLCTDTTYILEISSAQLADLTDPVLNIRGITGVSFSSIEVEYPKGSGNIEILTPTVSPNLLTLNLLDHSQIATQDGIKGTGNANTPEERFITVTLDVQFTCTFSPNSSMSFAVRGNQPCGDPAIGNAVKTKTNAIRIDGAVAPYNAFTGTSVSPSPIRVEYCNNSSNVRIQTTIIGDTTTVNDTTEVFLPLGVTYSTGSFNCISGICPTSAFVDTVNNRPRIVFPLPSGIPSGTTLDYNFDVVGTPGGGCSFNEELEVNSYVIAGNINCLGTPCGPVKIITGEAEERVLIEKPDFVISNLDGRSFNAGTAQNYTVTQEITNIGLDAPSGLVVQYYCLDAMGNPTGTSIGNSTVSSPITNGQTIFDTVRFVVTPALPCTDESSIYSMIAPSPTQCICDTVFASARSLLLSINFSFFDAKLINENEAILTWGVELTDNNTTFEIETILPNQTILEFKKIGAQDGISNQKNYKYTVPNLMPGVHYFRIKTIEADGTATYSKTKSLTVKKEAELVSVYPNPTTGLVSISSTAILDQNINIEVFNSLGQKVASFSKQYQPTTTLDFSHLVNGNYILKISNSTVNKNFKLTISK